MKRVLLLLMVVLFMGLHGPVEAADEEETRLFKKGEAAFRQNSYESSIDYLSEYIDKYGENGRFGDAVLFYLGESFSSVTGEYYMSYKMVLDKTEEEMRGILGEKSFEDLRAGSIERNLRMGSENVEDNPEIILNGMKSLYAENMFFQKYGRFNRFRRLEFGWYPPIYTKNEYVELLNIHRDSEWAVKAFLRLANIRLELDRKSPIANFNLLEYEGFGSFVVLVGNCLDLYRKYEVRKGLDAALEKLNLLYPEAGHVSDATELSDAASAYEEILIVLPDGENSRRAEEVLKDLRLRLEAD